MASCDLTTFRDILQCAVLARTSGFDLIGEEGIGWLIENLAMDFPTLAPSELATIINQGIKGDFNERYTSTVLNVTKIYNWVKIGSAVDLTQPTPRHLLPPEGSDCTGRHIVLPHTGDANLNRIAAQTYATHFPNATIHHTRI